MFLKTSLTDYNIKYIVTDGDVRYKKIITNLGYIQQRCTFHLMKNLMDDLSQRHNTLKRKIKNLNEQIPKKQAKLEELKKEYSNKRGRSKKDDKKRQKNINDKKKLTREISQLKAKRRKYKKILKDDETYVKRISLIFKCITHQAAINKFNQLYDKKEEMSEEIQKFLERLKDNLKDALNHTLNKSVPNK